MELLGELHRLHRLLGKVPSEDDMAERGGYGVSTYRTRFGSWSEAIEAAGWEPNPDRTHRSDEALQAELYRLRDELGQVPTSRDMDTHGEFSRGVYRNRWGSWNEAIEEAGLPTRTHGMELSRTELIAELRRLADELGRCPTTTDMNEHGEYSHSIYYNEFESWRSALEAASLDEDSM
ncbi:homing endonuclease associated repeat-containing protein [Halobacterium salinarum]|uniref:homing endonuclease associated repeat-containing protein n=1 Tax=Halobacterium salinarum TaxID=2242 RepID=UPI003D77A3BE